MFRELKSSLVLLLICVVLGCLVYPAAVLLTAHAIAPEAAKGSLLTSPDGTLVGSRLIAQSFTNDRYFWPRPSAVGYNGAAAGARSHTPTGAALRGEVATAYSNLAPTSTTTPVPSDLITASGSGLAPDITAYAARWQVPRVAKARGMDEGELRCLVEGHVERHPGLETVNVLELNLDIDQTLARRGGRP